MKADNVLKGENFYLHFVMGEPWCNI